MTNRVMIIVALGFLVALATAARAADAPAITHSFLAAGAKTYIMLFDTANPKGKIVWEYPASTREGWVLPSGNILLAVSKGGKYPGGGAVELTRDNKVVWEYKGTQDEVNCIQKTAEGNYLVGESGKKPKLIEMDAAGKVIADVPLQCQNGNSHMETRMARKLADGTYLAPHLLDFAVKQYDATGKVLKVIDTKQAGAKETWPFTAIRLGNGNTVCGLTHSGRVAEYDAEGKIVWQVTNEEVGGIIKDACGVQRLPNGNTVITSYAAPANQVKLFEVTPEKKVVWTYTNGDPHGIHHFQILDTNGVPIEGTPLR